MKVQINHSPTQRKLVAQIALSIENLHQQEGKTHQTVQFQEIDGSNHAVEQFVLALLRQRIPFGVDKFYEPAI